MNFAAFVSFAPSYRLVQLCRAALFIGLCSFSASSLRSQEAIGSVIDNYTPATAMLLNPSVIADQKPWLDIDLVGFHLNLANNIGFVEDATVFGLVDTSSIRYAGTANRAWADVNARLNTLTGSLSLGKQAVGMHISVRQSLIARRMPMEYLNFYLSGEPSSEDSTVTPLSRARVKTLTWGEVGVSYSRILYQFDRHLFTGGTTVNRLFGIAAGSFFADVGLLEQVGREVDLLEGTGSYSYAPQNFRAGRGWSTSLGVTYKRMIDDVTQYTPHSFGVRCRTLPYKFKFAASLVDVGAIKMKTDANYHRWNASESPLLYLNVIEGSQDPTELNSSGTDFLAWLPMGLNLQYDYNFENGFFAGGMLTQRLSTSSMFGTERSNLLAASLRYERKSVMVAVPVSIQNYKAPHIGLALRLWSVTIGTDHVLPFFVKGDIYSADFYFHLHLRWDRGPGCKMPKPQRMERFQFRNMFQRKNPRMETCPTW